MTKLIERKILIIGYSHTRMIWQAATKLLRQGRTDMENVEICWISHKEGDKGDTTMEAALEKAAALGPQDLLVLSVHGAYHHIIGVLNHDIPFSLIETVDGPVPVSEGTTIIPYALMRRVFDHWVKVDTMVDDFVARAACQVVHFCPPPPKDNLVPHPSGIYRGRSYAEQGYAPKPSRLALWKLEVDVATRHLAQSGVTDLGTPAAALTDEGYLADDYLAPDMTHANAAYGRLLLDQIADLPVAAPIRTPSKGDDTPVSDDPVSKSPAPEHPYSSLPDKAFWRRSVARPAMADVDPVGVFDLKLTPETKVATAGSCFAQHIARHLQGSGFNYYVTEPGHPVVPARILAQHNYGTFSARYGNIYTARQLRQLVERAYGRFTPQEPAWTEPDGTVRDPFRPTVQPGNYVSVAEMEADRAQHLAAVRTMLETLDVFVFTLGLTECWRSVADGAVFPLCPGVDGGTFDPERYEFYNQTAPDVIEDLTAVLEVLRSVNPAAQVILTVSPVPLMATADPGAHVLSATTLSKSILRVAADTITRSHDHVHYFPSFEVITGAYNRGAYYADDLRNVTETGVAHAMRLFLAHATGTAQPAKVAPAPAVEEEDAFMAAARKFVEVECDEIALDREK